MKFRILLAIGLAAAGCSDAAREKSYLLRHAPVTLSQAARVAEAHVPGRAVRVELDQRGNRVVYEVEIIDILNKTRQVKVDAETGKVM